MCNSKELSNEDLSYLEICVSGGDKMPLELQEKTQEFLKKHNAKANIWIGYGATEASSGLCCVKDDCFRYESIGAPYLKDIFEVYDLDTGEPICGHDKIGELRVTGPTIMVGYTGKHKEEMKDVIKEDDFGNRWYCTGDLAHFDKDGMVYIDGRIKRIITRRGFKIYPAQIEKLVMHHPYIKECAIVGIPDDEELNIPVANIVLNENVPENAKDEVISFVDNIISKNFPEYTVMAGYNFLDEMPLTPIGKLDFRSLEQIGIIDNKGKRLQKRFDKK
jgi:long-chain acyl-CoA synthetase